MMGSLGSHRFQLSYLHWLHDLEVGLSSYPGQGDVRKTRWYRRTIQPHQEMLKILSLRFADGPGVCWSEWISHDISLSLHCMGHRIDKGTLLVCKRNYDRLPMI